jgi:hypothetical protein
MAQAPCSGATLAGLSSPASFGVRRACHENRAFDFWIGEWRVHSPNGKLAGTHRISSEHNGGVICEHNQTGRGDSGEGLNTHDAGRKVWHQT